MSDHRFAMLLSKTHHAVVDGTSAVDIGQLVLDETPERPDIVPDAWRPAPAPGWSELVAGALAETVRRPRSLVDNVRAGIADVEHTAGRALDAERGDGSP
ncbi:MAG TPA: wax ester/triacylglycerol synthase domain-containing protein [Jiangellaceae bacterium]|nr:wax ester/triacylglycerol synthase domain-containing protein [Jiangellaceae bacterium]